MKSKCIAGDHVVTASAIAKELGILENSDKAITGETLDTLTDTELNRQIEHIEAYQKPIRKWQKM